MIKKHTPVMEIQNYRIVKTVKGTYRIQYRKKRTFWEVILRKNAWSTICIDFDHDYRLRAKLYFYLYKDSE